MVQFYACFNFFLCFGYDNIRWWLSNKVKGLTKINNPHHKMYSIIVNTAVFSRCRLSCTLWKFILGKARRKGLLTYTITPESLLLCHNGKVKFSLHTGNSIMKIVIVILIQLILLSCMGVERWWLVLPLMLMRVIWCNILFTSHVWVQCPSAEILLHMCRMILG